MPTIFDQYISIYKNVEDTVGDLTMITNFLNSRRHYEQICHIRSLPTKKERDVEKVKLPLATISGVFRPTRNKLNLASHSGFICIDIDLGDNLHLPDIEVARPILESRPEVAYAAHSVSGTGYFALIPLKHPGYHVQQFRQLMTDYGELGIKLDKSCSDVTRLRCVSFDESPYINLCATPYEGLHVETLPENYHPTALRESNDLKKVCRCCEMIQQHRIDITGNYNDWFTVGSALSSLGEDGRYWYHVCSSMSPSYSREETDKKFTECLRSITKVSIGTFFYLCQQYGISYCRRREG